MQFGNIQGLVNGTETVVFDYEVAGSAASSISTGNILNGDEDGWYTVIARNIYDTGTATMEASFNADTTAANYGYRGISAASTTVGNISSTAALIRMGAVASSSTSAFSVLRFYAKSGAVRLLNGINVCNLSGTTVTQLETIGSVWNETASNITGMTFTANKLGVGTRIIILKSNNFTGGTPTGSITTPYIKGSWVRVGSSVLGGAASSVTFSGLDGDRDVVYYLSGQTQASGGANQASARFNADTGGNYGQQWLSGKSTTVAAARRTGDTRIDFNANSVPAQNSYSQYGFMLFAKSGFVRPSILTMVSEAAGTTVAELYTAGCVWSDTANNMTSLAISTPNNFAAGSQFDLWALRPLG